MHWTRPERQSSTRPATSQAIFARATTYYEGIRLDLSKPPVIAEATDDGGDSVFSLPIGSVRTHVNDGGETEISLDGEKVATTRITLRAGTVFEGYLHAFAQGERLAVAHLRATHIRGPPGKISYAVNDVYDLPDSPAP